MIGKAISHYRILEKLGGGRMDEIYGAEETKLGRQVAVKVLPDLLARDPERGDARLLPVYTTGSPRATTRSTGRKPRNLSKSRVEVKRGIAVFLKKEVKRCY
jgi:serine/threonine protein kinase